MDDAAWKQLWITLDVLERRGRDLRRLSQEEPLKKARPDYPRAGAGRSHDDELRGAFADLEKAFAETIRLLPAALRDGAVPPVVPADETQAALAGRLSALQKFTTALATQAFEPLPPLPPHAPPYLVTIPGHDLASSKALLLGNGIIDTVTALRNTLVAAANAASSQ